MRSYFIRKGHHHPMGYLFHWLTNIFSYTSIKKVKQGRLLNYSGYFQINAELIGDYIDDSISKVTGIGIGLPKWSWKERRFVHANSVRIGFRRSIEKPHELEIWSYAYVNGQRVEELMMPHKCEHEGHLYMPSIELETQRFRYHITVDCNNNKEIEVLLVLEHSMQSATLYGHTLTKYTIHPKRRTLLYRMLPYYGGKKPAPERVWIDIWKEVFKRQKPHKKN